MGIRFQPVKCNMMTFNRNENQPPMQQYTERHNTRIVNITQMPRVYMYIELFTSGGNRETHHSYQKGSVGISQTGLTPSHFVPVPKQGLVYKVICHGLFVCVQ